MNPDDRAFQPVFNEEMAQWIIPRRRRESQTEEPNAGPANYYPKVDNRLVGLALSGGGVKAATFALGVLQRLARLGILRFVDILSTASGGGYLGASWSSLTADSPVTNASTSGARTADDYKYGSGISDFPFKFVDNAGEPDRQIFDRESDAVRHIRAHGNWLAPHIGLFDVWTWVALVRYVTSTAINLALMPVPWILGIMGLTMLVPNDWWDRQNPLGSPIALYMWTGPAVLLAIFGLFTWWGYPKANVPGAEIKHRLYWLLKGVLVLGIGWVLAALFVLGVAGAYFIDSNLWSWWKWLTGLSPVALIGVVGAIYRSFTGGMEGGVPIGGGGTAKKAKGLLLGTTGYLSLAVILLMTYFVLEDLLFLDPGEAPRAVTQVTISGVTTSWRTIVTFIALAIAVLMLFVPVRGFLNFFSLQALYRRGLRRAYILRAASQEEMLQESGEVVPRAPEKLLLKDLKKGDNPPDMPYHLIGTTLNTSGDTQLQRLGRRSDSFVLAHLHSGSRVTGYAPMATSGAFKNISLSEATTTSMAILMALFNVRIGSWIRKPGDEKRTPASRRLLVWHWLKELSGWRPLVWYWLKELFGMASAEDRYIYLTDGGHFDNSGIYELLKRRCKYILAVDASSDVGNLATVARLARIDLGVQIDVDLGPLIYGSPTQLSEQSFVVGKLRYPPIQGDVETEGVLV